MTCSHARTGWQPLQQLIRPQFDLVEMHIKMLGKPSHGLLTVNDYKGNFRFEAGSVIATRASGLSGSPVVGRACRLRAANLTFSLVQISRYTSLCCLNLSA